LFDARVRRHVLDFPKKGQTSRYEFVLAGYGGLNRGHCFLSLISNDGFCPNHDATPLCMQEAKLLQVELEYSASRASA